MKFIIPGFVILMILISGLGASSLSIQETMTGSHFTLSFSRPMITSTDNTLEIEIPEANAITNTPNEPMVPLYQKTLYYPADTIIQDVTIIPSQKILQIDLTRSLPIAPTVSPPGIHLKPTDDADTKKISETHLFPEKWYDYSISRGLYKNTPSVILTIICYPVRVLENTIYYSNDFTINIQTNDQQTPQQQTIEETLLIIAPVEFEEKLQPFVTHKESKGITTILATLEDIYDGSHFPVEGRDEAEKVKYFIKNAYDTWNIKYVLLVGGRKAGITESWYVPVRYVHVFWADETQFMSDLYFADLYNADNSFSTWDNDANDVFSEWPEVGFFKDDIDLYPEVLLGRWPVRNMWELDIIIKKTIEYENMQTEKKIVLVGGDNFEEPGIEGEIVCDKSLEYLPDFTVAKVYASEMDITPENMKAALGDGAMFMHMHGHGSPVKWGTHTPDGFDEWMDGLYITDVPWFFNDQYPILILGGCHTAMFNVSIFNRPWIYGYRLTPEGLGWMFARKVGGGGIATFGYTCFPVASPGEYGDLNGDGINEPDCVESGYGFIQLQLLKGYGVEQYQYLGECWNYAISTYLDTYKIPYERWHLHTTEGFALLGDPSLKIGGYI